MNRVALSDLSVVYGNRARVVSGALPPSRPASLGRYGDVRPADACREAEEEAQDR